MFFSKVLTLNIYITLEKKLKVEKTMWNLKVTDFGIYCLEILLQKYVAKLLNWVEVNLRRGYQYHESPWIRDVVQLELTWSYLK